MYTHLFFDVDDTLLDFAAGEHYSLSALFQSLALGPFDEVFATYRTINRALWDASERGEIGVEDLMNARFTELLAAFHLTGDGSKIDEQFRANLAADDFSMPGARELLADLHHDYTIAIATNGIATTQEARLCRADMWSYIDASFVSNEIGVQKPDVRFFEAMLTLPRFSKATSLMIGDSLTSDMEGARRFGMPRCWYNPERKPLPTLPIDYIIDDFDDLRRLLQWQQPTRVALTNDSQTLYFVGEGPLPTPTQDLHETAEKMREAGYLATTLAEAAITLSTLPQSVK